VQIHVGMALKEVLHRFCFVRGKVVQDDVRLAIEGLGIDDIFQERQAPDWYGGEPSGRGSRPFAGSGPHSAREFQAGDTQTRAPPPVPERVGQRRPSTCALRSASFQTRAIRFLLTFITAAILRRDQILDSSGGACRSAPVLAPATAA